MFRKASDHLRILRIQGDDSNVETIRTTDEHPFYVQSRGWTGAGELSIGELLQEADGTWQAVLGSERQAFADGVTVYNLEVADGHTYFVEDGADPADAVWVHNQCVGGKFFASYKGKPIEFKNSKPGSIVFRKRSAAETTALRDAFDSTERKNFVKHVANTKPGELRAAGFADDEIQHMGTGGTLPSSKSNLFQVHHKQPLDGGGDNSFDNLIIIKQKPYHAALTTEQQRYVGDLAVGEHREIDFPLFTGKSIYTGG